MQERTKMTSFILGASTALLLSFQNCSRVSFEMMHPPVGDAAAGTAGTSDSGEGAQGPGTQGQEDQPSIIQPSSNPNLPPSTPTDNPSVPPGLTPLALKPGVVTILMALGDQLNDDLVVKGASAQLIAETMVRFASPVVNPKVLVVRDQGHNGETAYDTEYIASVLLARYQTQYIEEPLGGLTDEMLEGYDLVWFNNPGHPMSQVQSRNALLNFKGGVVLSGDDMAHGKGFSMEELTGLKYVDNGTSVVCDGQSYAHDNNSGSQYRVGLNADLWPSEVPADTLNFHYGNDIDNTIASTIAASDASPGTANVEILGYAQGGPEACNQLRPSVVRYVR